MATMQEHVAALHALNDSLMALVPLVEQVIEQNANQVSDEATAIVVATQETVDAAAATLQAALNQAAG